MSEDPLAVPVESGQDGPVHGSRSSRDLPAVAGGLGLKERPVEVEAVALTPAAGKLAVDVMADAADSRSRPRSSVGQIVSAIAVR
jgi:hypothetical protein